MLDVSLNLRVDVLYERAARGDIHHLESQANAERRDATLAGHPGKAEVVVLAAGVHRVNARMLLFAIDRGIAVIPTSEQDSIELINDFSGVLRLRRDDDRDCAGAAEGVGAAHRVFRGGRRRGPSWASPLTDPPCWSASVPAASTTRGR